MNDGENSKEAESNLRKRRRKGDEFAQGIARIAVAQVCESVGFQGFQESALETFSDVVCKYVRDIGKSSSGYANLAGRSECNVFDVVRGLEDLNMSQGFVGAASGNYCLAGSGIVREISQFVSLSEEVGFAYTVPSFPVVKERKTTPSFVQAGETPLMDDIPPWLPRFPDPETYGSMSLASKEEVKITTDVTDQEAKVIEPTLLKPDQHLVHNESVFPAAVEQGYNAGLRGSNPFLAVPLQPGEKAVSSVSLPAKLKEEDTVGNYTNHVFELDTIPSNQEVKNGVCDTGEGSRKVVMNERPIVQMKFHIGKGPLDTAIMHNGKWKEDVASWFLNDEMRNEEEKKPEKLPSMPMDIQEKRPEKFPSVPMDIEENIGNDSIVN